MMIYFITSHSLKRIAQPKAKEMNTYYLRPNLVVTLLGYTINKRKINEGVQDSATTEPKKCIKF